MLMMILRHSLVFAFLLFLASANGRSLLQKNFNSEDIDDLQVLSNDTGVSLATDPSYNGKTNYNDVLGMLLLVKAFPLLSELDNNDEDPCFPPKWSWIECNSDLRPRITALNLRNRLLVGVLPDFSIMEALQTIDLSHNTLIGDIPSFLGRFPDLQELNLAYNLFSGPVPDSLACNKDLDLTVTGNTNVYASNSCSTPPKKAPSSTSSRKAPPPVSDEESSTDSSSSNSSSDVGGSIDTPTTARRSQKKSNLPIILGASISAFVVFWIAVGVFAIHRHKAKSTAAIAQASPNPEVEQPTADSPPVEMPMKTDSNNNTNSPQP